MLDLIFLASPIFMAWLIFIGYLEPKFSPDETRFNHLLSGLSLRHVKPPVKEWTFEAPDAESQKLWGELQKESEAARLVQAKRALDNICDVSCDSVAEALDLPIMKVRKLSTKGRRKKGSLGEYSKEEILNAAKAPVEALAYSIECPF